MVSGFRVSGFQGLGFKVYGSGFRVSGFRDRLRAWQNCHTCALFLPAQAEDVAADRLGLGGRQGSLLRVQDSGFGVYGLGFGV